MRNIVIILLFLSSCASNEDKVFVDQVSPDLVETFKIENKKFQKFVVEEKAPPIKAPSKNIKIEDKKTEKISKVKARKKIRLTKKITLAKKARAYPKSFPQELIDLDKESKKTWHNYTPLYKNGEEFIFSINYLGITAGHVRFITRGGLKVSGHDALHFRALFRTSKFYKYVYEADDMVETYVTADKFLPIKYSLVQRESNKDVDDLQLFDHDEFKTYLFYKRLKKKNNQLTKKDKESYIPKYFQDFMSTLFFVRGLPLNKSDVYKFPVYTRGKFWRLNVKVSKKEKIKIMGKWVKAIRLDTVAFPPKVDKKKSKSTISFWYSDSPERIFLKLQAKLKFGSIEGELQQHIPGQIR